MSREPEVDTAREHAGLEGEGATRDRACCYCGAPLPTPRDLDDHLRDVVWEALT